MHARIALALSLTFAGVVFAQPSNDTCDTALVIPAPTGRTLTHSPVSAPFGSVSAAETPMTCAAAVQNTVWYTFTPVESGRYELSSCNLADLLQTSAVDFAMAVYAGPCNALAQITNGCNDDWCSTRPRVVVDLTGGQTYRIQIGRADSPSVASDTIQLSAQRTSGADTCAGPVPDLPLNTTVQVATIEGESNDAQIGGGLACYAGIGHVTTLASAEATRRDRVHRFTAPHAGAYSFRAGLSLRSYDTLIHLTDSCTAAMTPPHVYSPPQCIGAANRSTSSSTAHEEISCVSLTANQEVFVWVDEGAVQTTASFGGSVPLEVTECVVETEPNDGPATASPLVCNTTGSIQVSGDVDFFALGTPGAGDRVFAMVEGAAAGSNGLQMRITTATDAIEFDTGDLDTNFGGTSPGIAGRAMSAEPHFIRVSHDTPTSTAQPYHVYSVIQPGTPVPEVEPNNTPADATITGTNYFSGTTTGTSAANFDVDFFAFQARAGDLIYLSLDSHPMKSGSLTSVNHTLALWDTSGAQVFVNDGTTTVNNTQIAGNLDAGTPTMPSEHLLYRAPTNGTYWARVSRTGTSATNPADYLLSISINCSTGGGFATPALSSLTPTSGSSLGGELVTLTGTGFGPGSTVTFGTAVATVVSATNTELVVRTPVGSAGATNVAVKNFTLGPSTLNGAYTYVTPTLPPTVTSVTPAQGSANGGQTVTIVGQLFANDAQVQFDVGGDVRAGTNVSVQNLTRLTVTTPAHVAGLATVKVRNPTTNLEGALVGGYTFNAAPVITAISPATGVITGGTTVTLTGSGFRSGALVRFGTGAGASVTVDPSGNSLTAVTPAATLNGPVDVIVINIDGQQTTREDGFRYQFPSPTLTSVSPAVGASAGGTTITLTGTNFFTSPTVLVNDVPAASVTRVSATQVTAMTPPGTPGVVSVTLANTDGQQTTAVAAFAYVAPPTVTSISPTTGSTVGGTRITVTGTEFQPGAQVRIGGSPAFGASMPNATTISALTPPGIAGMVDVEVVNPDSQRGVLAGAFIYEGAPTLTAVSPAVGSTAGGTVVTLTGTGFATGSDVVFGTLEATSVTVVSNTQMTAVAPAAPMSVVAITLRNADGQTVTLPSAFRYVDGPTLSSLAPSTGDVSGGTVVRLTGAGFGAETSVRFGTTASPLVTLVNPTTLDAVTPASEPGSVDVTVVNSDGAEATLTNAFTFTRAAPSISVVAPASGPVTGGTMLTVSGSGFATNVTVSIGGVALTNVVRASPELLRGRAPAHAAGIVDVVVTNDDGQSVTAANAYTYVATVDGNMGVADGGTGGLGEEPVVEPPLPTGCGCSGVEGSALMFAALGLLLRRRRR